MTEAKPNEGNSDHPDSIDAISQPEHADDGASHEVTTGAAVETTSEGAGEAEEETEEEEEDEEGGEEDEEAGEEEADEEEEEEEEEDEEPRLKYARLTQHLAAVYRNGDSTSAFLVAGDKMIVGTHKGNIVMSPQVPSSYGYAPRSCIVPSMLTSHLARRPTADLPVLDCIPCTRCLSYEYFHLPLPASDFTAHLKTRCCG